MEAIILAGGKAERLGAVAGGRPKPLVPVAGRPLIAYQVDSLAAAGVERVIVSCSVGQENVFAEALADIVANVVPVAEPEPLGRGGGLRFAARAREESGDVYALNGDELLDLDFGALLARHRETGAAATITVTQPPSAFGVVDLGPDDAVTGFREAGRLPHWVSCGVYVLGEEALARLPERGDHERSTFPELAAEGRLRAFRHEGVWLTVNTPKDLRVAEEFLVANGGRLTPARASVRTGAVSEQTPNLLDLDRFAVPVERVEKPWGHEIIFALTDRYCGKVLFIRKGEQLSLQFHRRKDEVIYVHEGRIELEVGEPGRTPDVEVVAPGRAFRFVPGTVHRWRALEDTLVLEVSTPDTDDVVRLEDRYGRADA